MNKDIDVLVKEFDNLIQAMSKRENLNRIGIIERDMDQLLKNTNLDDLSQLYAHFLNKNGDYYNIFRDKLLAEHAEKLAAWSDDTQEIKKTTGLLAKLREKLPKAKDKQPVVEEIREIADDATRQVSTYHGVADELFDLYDETDELFVVLEDGLEESPKKKEALSGLSKLKSSISQSLSDSFSRQAIRDKVRGLSFDMRVLKLSSSLSQLDKESKQYEKMNQRLEGLIKRGNTKQVGEAIKLLTDTIYKTTGNPRLVDQLRATNKLLNNQLKSSASKKSPLSAFTKAVSEAKASSSKDEVKYKLFKEEVNKFYNVDHKNMPDKSLDKMMKQIESALSKIKDPQILEKAVSDLYALKVNVRPNSKGTALLDIRLDQALNLSEKVEKMIQKYEPIASAQPKI